jgi:hypothetical protein
MKGSGQMDRATGQFVWNDGRKQDSFEAMLENIVGGAVQYPQQRYRAPVQIKTEAFPWVDVEPGVSAKTLARFNAAGPELGLVRLSPGAAFEEERSDRHRIFCVFSGEAECGGKKLSESSYVYCPPGMALEPFRAASETVIFGARFESK